MKLPIRRRPPHLPLLLGAALAFAFCSGASAGISPENVVVVVNADSLDSRTIANHYIDLRDIPTANVILLEDVPAGLATTLAVFKEKILSPILTEIDKRGLSNQARVIAYSAGFPTTVDITPHHDKLGAGLKKIQNKYASINGLTYFFRAVLSDEPFYLSLSSNLYSRGEFSRTFANPFAG